jgi:cytochrome P450 family 313
MLNYFIIFIINIPHLDDFVAPKNTLLIVPILNIHRDKTIWGEDSFEFKPERFEPENMKNIHPYAYIPFSNGGRMCPGYKYAMIVMKIFISRFLMEYRVTSANMKYEDLEIITGISNDFKRRPLIRVERR